MKQAYIIDGVRTPIGNFAGTLASIRTDDLAALVIKTLMERNLNVDPNIIEDVIFGCANQCASILSERSDRKVLCKKNAVGLRFTLGSFMLGVGEDRSYSLKIHLYICKKRFFEFRRKIISMCCNVEKLGTKSLN
jgi:hypothetical protein